MFYRWDIIGHEQALGQLENEIQSGNINHAYLFAGPPQTGKFRLALQFASILQCRQNFCRSCADCKGVQNRAHPDTLFLEDDGEAIKIDAMRELIRKTHLTSQGQYRVIVMENIERMPVEAQNAFLKTLEEPPGKTVFLLTTNKIQQVIPTLLSRVRQYFFFNTNDARLEQALEDEYGKHPDLKEVINLAQGRPGLAISLLTKPKDLLSERELYHKIERLLQKNDLAQKFQWVEEMEKDDRAVERFFDAFTRFLRKLLYEYAAQKNHPLRSRFSLEKLTDLFENLEKTRYFIERNINRRLALENFMLATETV